MNRQLLTLLVLATVAVVGSAALGGSGIIELYQDPIRLPDGNWEYIYDVTADDMNINNVYISDFDASLGVNQFLHNGRTYYQKWDWASANSYWNFEDFGSYSNDGVNWLLPNKPWAFANAWHDPAEYQRGTSMFGSGPLFSYGGQVDGQGIKFPALRGVWSTGLVLTFRVVHPYAPGEINWAVNSFYGGSSGTVDGPKIAPPAPPVGSLDGDMDVDGDDIDLMGDYIRTGVRPAGADPNVEFDLSDDGTTGGAGGGTIDLLDLDYLIRKLVNTTAVDAGGVPLDGTEYGDFNLDGIIDTTDLTRLGTFFGGSDLDPRTWDAGNANRNIDLTIDTTDLTILGTFFGADNGGVDAIPEPMTMSLLALGGAMLIRRRKS